MIGAFILGAVALMVVSLVVFGSGKFLKKTYKYAIFFRSNTSGLSIGAPVKLRGVQMGTVVDIAAVIDAK